MTGRELVSEQDENAASGDKTQWQMFLYLIILFVQTVSDKKIFQI